MKSTPSPDSVILAEALESTLAMLLEEGQLFESGQPGESFDIFTFPRASIRGAINEIQAALAILL